MQKLWDDVAELQDLITVASLEDISNFYQVGKKYSAFHHREGKRAAWKGVAVFLSGRLIATLAVRREPENVTGAASESENVPK